MTEILHVDPDHPDPALIARAAEVLRRGGLVAFPTETVYGLGANALDATACAGIFTAKGRPAHNPIIVHVASVREARQVTALWPVEADRLAERFWPGPLTLVLPRRPEVPDVVTAGGPTVAVRVPAHPVALALLRACQLPVAAPSANRSGELSPTRGEHVLRSLDGKIDMLLEGGPAAGGLESTVLDLSRTPAVLLRPGLVSLADLETLLGVVARPTPTPTPTPTPAGTQPILASPGMLDRHYAPRTPLTCIEGSGAVLIAELQQQGWRVGWVRFGYGDAPTQSAALVTSLPAEPAGYASQLYALLHQLDNAGLDRLILELPPATDAWLAVRDRLRRAATP